MPVRLMRELREELFQIVRDRADEYGYMRRTRPENRVFLENLLHDPDVGGRLADYMPKEAIRTYLKDAYLNRYSKEHRPLPRSIDNVLGVAYGGQRITEVSYDETHNASWHRRPDGSLILAVRTGSTKWETGLRWLLQTAAQQVVGNRQYGTELVLVVCEHGNGGNEGDRGLIEDSLGVAGVRCIWA